MTKHLGQTLVEILIDNAFPARDLSDPEFVSFPDVAKLFFDNAKMFRDAAVESGHDWSVDSISQADDWLIGIAEDGQFDGVRTLKSGMAEELWRRWQYATLATALEAEGGQMRPALTLPRNIPDDLKGMAVMIYFLAGEGRDYPAR